MWLVDDVADYVKDRWNSYKFRKEAEKKAYQEAYMEKKLEYLKEKGGIDAKVHVFGKDAVNFNTISKPFDKATR